MFRTSINTVMNFWVPEKRIISWLDDQPLGPKEGLLSIELISIRLRTVTICAYAEIYLN